MQELKTAQAKHKRHQATFFCRINGNGARAKIVGLSRVPAHKETAVILLQNTLLRNGMDYRIAPGRDGVPYGNKPRRGVMTMVRCDVLFPKVARSGYTRTSFCNDPFRETGYHACIPPGKGPGLRRTGNLSFRELLHATKL